jgi:hypothetical protein
VSARGTHRLRVIPGVILRTILAPGDSARSKCHIHVMPRSSTAPSLDPEEAAALDQLEKIETALCAKPMPRVAERLRRLSLRFQGREALSAIHRAVDESGEPPPTEDEIDQWISEVRAQVRSKR